MDKMREEFEAWYMDYHHKGCGKDYWGVVFSIGSNGMYQGIACEEAWQGWKASRSALCVEIPTEGEASSFGNYVVFDSDDVRAMLDAAGVRYK